VKRDPVLVNVGVALAVALALVVLLRATGHPLRPWWFVAAALAIGAVSLAWRQLGGLLVETDWPERAEQLRRPSGGERRVQYLATWMRESERNPDVFRDRIQPVLATAVRARLLRRHGIDLAVQPDAARAVTGDWLWEVVSGSEPRRPTYDELTKMIDAVEGL
jgi:hypothetical protein